MAVPTPNLPGNGENEALPHVFMYSSHEAVGANGHSPLRMAFPGSRDELRTPPRMKINFSVSPRLHVYFQVRAWERELTRII